MQKNLRTMGLWALVLTSAFLFTMCASPVTSTGSGAAVSLERALATGNADFTANVMAPLKVTDWATFEAQLATVKGYGVDAVSVDVWWGDVEVGGDNTFDWSYYDTLFQKTKAKGLKLVPILSFHQCGGNVGDTYTSVLPSWLWSKYSGQTLNGVTLDSNGLKHKSEQGNFSSETVQGWADALVLNEYNDFAAAFAARYGAAYASDMQEINVSLGPAGELRYPSYNSHDSGTGYPSRGALQSYSPLAVKDFQTKMIAKYGSLAGVNAAWGTVLGSVTQIQPPSNAATFFSSGDYKNIAYGRDLIDWYNQSLVDHGKRMLDTVSAALGSSFPGAKLGYKIPGVHWAMTNPSYPRAAEVAAGLVQTSVDMNADATGHGYQKVVGLAKTITTSRPMILHFTCLEMDDQNFASQYSLAKTLVFWVAQNAAAQAVTIKGENALSGGITGDAGWNNINNAFDNASYLGFTTLRVGEVASGTGQARYSQFIAKYRTGTGFPSLYVRGTNNAWGLTAMTKTAGVWSVNNVTFGATGTERFKFDVKGDWTQNYGGSGLTGTAVASGGDIAVAAGATYNITFNEATLAYAATLVPTSTYSISGTVSGSGVSGVTVTAGSQSAVTNAGGVYTITGLANGSYTVTPSKAGSTFTPASAAVTLSGANQTGVNFTAAAATTITLKMTKDVGSGNAIFFTGSLPGLTNWGTGVQGTWTTGNVWTLTIADPGVAFEWKVRKGTTGGAGNLWESGANHNQANLWPAFNGGF